MISKDAVWFITGCSKGLGLALAREVAAAGYRVAATARNQDDLQGLSAQYGDAILALALDVTRSDQAETAIAAAKSRFGRIDVLVNNAGYGYIAAIEEGEPDEVRALFDTDLFAPVALIKKVLPEMRARRTGHIVNVSSIGGLVSYPGVGYYNMAKAGVEAMSDALAQELAPFGIGVTVVAPGAFRTDFRGGSLKMSGLEIGDYAGTAGKARISIQGGHGKQKGDPAKAARAIILAVEAERPPVHLVLGGDAFEQLQAKLERTRSDAYAWESVTRGTDLDQ